MTRGYRFGPVVATAFFRRFHTAVRLGYGLARTGGAGRTAMGMALLAYGVHKSRKRPKLIYETSLNVDDDVTIRVLRGRRPIAESAPIGAGRR